MVLVFLRSVKFHALNREARNGLWKHAMSVNLFTIFRIIVVWCCVFENVKLSLHYLFAFYTTLIILDWITYDVIRISISRIWLCVRFANLLVFYALNFHDRLNISISHYLPRFVFSMKHRFQKYWNWALLFWPSLSNMIGGWIMFGTSCEGQDVGESCPLLILPCKFSNVFRISLKDGRWSASKFQDYE